MDKRLALLILLIAAVTVAWVADACFVERDSIHNSEFSDHP